jgi:hypothetical protein
MIMTNVWCKKTLALLHNTNDQSKVEEKYATSILLTLIALYQTKQVLRHLRASYSMMPLDQAFEELSHALFRG